MKRLSPAPSKAATSLQEVRRNVYCTHYGTCLDYALRKCWDGFTCDGCDAYEREELSAEDAYEEFIRCLALIYLIAFPEPEPLGCGGQCADGRKQPKMSPHLAAGAGNPGTPAYV